MSKFKTPNGKAEFEVPDHQDKFWIDQGYKKSKGKKPRSNNKDTARNKPISKVVSGEDRTN